MMFGWEEKFDYFQCSSCGCLQIREAPQDMAGYYPREYYSYSSTNPVPPTGIWSFLKNRRDISVFLGKGLMGRVLSAKRITDPQLKSIAGIHLSENSAILDIGCGRGDFLRQIRKIGFRNLLGIDPFLKEEIDYADGLRIKKMNLHETGGKWDLIMFHHSFEHMINPLETLISVSKILSKGGLCLIRIPTVSSYAWESYSVNWIQIDAPRHPFLFSIRAMEILAAKADLRVERIAYDSTDFQFWGSEQALRGIPLVSDRSYYRSPSRSIFSEADIHEFRKRSKELNAKNRGDQAAFYLRSKE